ncbi:MAG: hypothetical protein R3323_08460 [Wenzhouxiangellaceae bacterium]|nr:hypothetical protein [Wenzhouxiangellaceae bacterium]
MKRILLAVSASILFLAGCGDDNGSTQSDDGATVAGAAPSASTGRSADAGPGFFARIDADTAYVMANAERLPEHVVDRMWAINDASSQSNEQMLQSLSEDEDIDPATRALVTELMSLTTREGWEAAGLPANPRYAIHGVSLLPMLHLELADEAAFRELVARVEAQLEQPLERREVDEEQVLWLPIDAGFGAAIHIGDTAVSAALLPDDGALLARLTGQVDPVDPMSADAFRRFNADNGFTPYSSGYLDWRRVLASLQDPSFPMAEEPGAGMLSDPACAVEFEALTEAMPRVIAGYTALDENAATFLARQQTSADLGARLAPISRSPVSLDRELSGLFSLGMAVDLVAAREFARSLVDGWAENPPQCMAFAGIAGNIENMQAALSRPIPPVVTNLHGLYIEALEFALGENGIPTGGGTLTMYMRNPQLLVGMAQMFSPAVAELDLQPGGEAKKVPAEALPQLQGLGLEGWMALGESAIGLAVGESQVSSMMDTLDATSTDPHLLSMQFDVDALTQLMDSAMSMVDDEEARQALETQRAQYEAMAEYYDAFTMRISLGEAGIDMSFVTTFE